MIPIRLSHGIILALVAVALLYGHPVARPIVDPVLPKCPENNSSRVYPVESIDIPAYQAEYAILDHFGSCELVSGPIMLIKRWPPAI